MRKIAGVLAAGLGLLLSAAASAGPVLFPGAVSPTITIDYSGGGTTGKVDLSSQAVYTSDGIFILNTPVSVPGVFEIQNLSVGTDPDPVVSYGFGVLNFLTSSPLSLVFNFLSPYIAGPYTTLTSQHQGGVTDGGAPGVTVSPYLGAFIHRPEIDGVAAPGNFGDGCDVTGSVSCDSDGPTMFGVATVPSGTFGVKVGFTLSAEDIYTTSGRVELSNVPEPGTWGLLLSGIFGLLAIARRRLN